MLSHNIPIMMVLDLDPLASGEARPLIFCDKMLEAVDLDPLASGEARRVRGEEVPDGYEI